MEATHSSPVWRDRANFIIGTPLSGSNNEVDSEQLWARRIGERSFEICCIPFFAYDLALGDVVETDAEYSISRRITPSGRFVFRVFFESDDSLAEATASALVGLGVLIEWSSPRLLALDCANEASANVVANFLQEREDRGLLLYETGRS